MADTATITTGSNATSNAVTLQSDTVEAFVQFKTANSGTPVSGDVVNFYALDSAGDIDADSTADYSTADHASLLEIQDTHQENPVVGTSIPVPLTTAVKIYADNEAASSVVVSAMLIEVGVDGVKTATRFPWS